MVSSRQADGRQPEVLRQSRAALLATTALQAAILCVVALPTAAQPSPNARPQGGVVVAGSAAISTGATATTIAQSTQRAAIDWKSFDVGSNQTVAFRQPAASSMTLNRITGQDPSAIAGRITANGGIVITNRSGVVFYPGSQVDATSVVVSAPGITNKNFMAGRMVFDQPAKPGAAVVNQGTITIKQAGLGALVAPEVRNAGTINAKLGHVVLAGAEAATLDMYGDGLLSVDVTKAVTKAPGGKAALVTNTGVIEADGGTVQLTAAAADAVVSTLVDAGGRIAARTLGNNKGAITIGGTGGGLLIQGSITATGWAAGTQGGAIEIAGTGPVEIAGTARVNASGRGGGGVVAIGTTLARATGDPSVTPAVIARQVRIAKDAKIAADARQQGNGGRVAVLGDDTATLNGQVTARGGKQGGNGGWVELSGKNGIGLGGTVDVSAPHGTLGDILLDPQTLNIVAGPLSCGSADSILITNGGTLRSDQPDTTSTQTVTNGAIQSLTGNLLLQATDVVNVTGSITLTRPGQSLTIQSGGDLNVDRDAPIRVAGDLTLEAAVGASRGTLQANGSLASTQGSVTLRGVTINTTSPVSASSAVDISTFRRGDITVSPLTVTNGPIRIDGGASVATTRMTATGDIVVNATGSIFTTGPIDSGSSVTLDPTASSTLAASRVVSCGAITANRLISIFGSDITIERGASLTAGSDPGAHVKIDATTSGASISSGSIASFGPIRSSGNVDLTAGALRLAAPVQAGPGGTVGLQTNSLSASSTIQAPSGEVAIAPLILGNTISVEPDPPVRAAVHPAPPGVLQLTTGTLAQIDTGGAGRLQLGRTSGSAGAVTTAGAIDFATGVDLTSVAGTLGLYAIGAVTQSGAGGITVDALVGPDPRVDPAPAGSLSLPNPANTIGSVGPFATSGDLELATARPLTIGGPLQAGSGATVILQADSISIPSRIDVAGGTVQIAPLTFGNSVSIDAATPAGNPPTNLSLPAGDLQNIRTSGGTLGIGFTNRQGVLAGPITITGTLDAASIAGTLDLQGRGTIAETTGRLLNLDMLTGLASGTPTTIPGAGFGAVSPSSVRLTNANTIRQLGPLQAGGSIEVGVTGDLVVNGPVTNLSCSVASAPITLRAGRNLTAAAADGNTVESTGALVLAAGVSDPTGGLTIDGAIRSGNGSLLLSSAGGGTTINAAVSAGSNSPSFGTPGQRLTIQSDAINAGQGGALYADGGTLEIAPATLGHAMMVTGTIPIGSDPGAGGRPALVRLGASTDPATGNLVTSAGSITFTADPFLNGPVIPVLDVNAIGSIAEASGVALTNITTLTGTTGALDLSGGNNRIAQLGQLASAGDLALTDAAALAITGPVQAGNGRVLSLTAPSVSILGLSRTTNGSLSVPPDTTVSPVKGGSVLLTTDALLVGGAIQAPSGLVAIAPLTRGNTILVDAVRPVRAAALGGLLELTTATLANIGTNGSLGAGTLALGSTDAGATTSAGAIAVNTGFDLTNISGTLGLYATGPVTQSPGADITVGTLIGPSIAPRITPDGTVTLTSSGNRIGSLGPFSAAGNFALADATDLTVIAPVDPADVAIATQGNLTIADAVIGNTVNLVAGGAITETRLGRVQADTLTGSAASASFTGANAIATLGGFSTTTGFALANAVPLTIAGPISDGRAIGLANEGTLTLTGDVQAPLINLVVGNGGIAQTSGTLAAGTLTGAASGFAQFGATPPATARIGTLASFSIPNGNLTLVDSAALTVGSLTAANFQVVAPDRITLSGGTITTTGLPLASQGGVSPAAPGSFFQVRPFAGASTFIQTGTTTIQSIPGTTATVRIDVGEGGTIGLDRLSAPGVNVVLGVLGGTATGTLDVGSLLVLGQTGSSSLQGTVGGQTGEAAAALARIRPTVNPAYLLNGCEIGVPNCGRPATRQQPDLATIVRNVTPTTVLPLLPMEYMAANNVVIVRFVDGDFVVARVPIDDADLTPQSPLSDHIRPRTVNLRLAFPPVTPGEVNPELVLPGVSSRDY